MVSIKRFKRILVVGSPGAGKTTFSKRLGQAMNIDVFHLDDYYWLKEWKRIDPNKWESTLHDLCNKQEWIIDGNHFKTLEKRLPNAQLLILLDYSVILCCWSFIVRSVKRYFRVDRETLPKQILHDINYRPKLYIQWHILKLILFFKLNIKPKIRNLAAVHSTHLIILDSRAQSEVFLKRQSEN